ncbi:MAG: hypothetical protein AAB225_01890 [Acidobacteriota bacterium]
MEPAGILHLHTYFLFPFSIDKQAVLKDHPEIWARHQHWIDGLDEWITAHAAPGASPVSDKLGGWRRAAYTRFDMDSPAYQDMVFFHPFVRRVFFDTTEESGEAGEKESLLRCYRIPLAGKKLWYEAEDNKGRRATVEVTDLRLFLFANGIGVLSIGVEAFRLPVTEALWINESMRKVYPSSGRQVREGRIPNRMTFVLEQNGAREVLVEEKFETGEMIGFLPPLARTITSLVYFGDYAQQEYEPVLDERMIVYTYFAVDPGAVPPDFIHSEDYQVLLSRFLYVDRDGPAYRYEQEFTRALMKENLYRRWAHQGTWYGFTSYSNITATIGTRDCDEHRLREGFLIHRMFDSRYYLMTLVALFYRATLLNFNERTALVSKRLYLDQEDGKLTLDNMRLANALRAEFLHFSNYWYFEELANKDEEMEHFALQCRQYRLEPMKVGIEVELEKLDASLHNYNQMRNTEAVNRLAMLSLILGAGAVLTGFFGMNFGRQFARLFFEPDQWALPVHWTAVVIVSVLAFTALAFGIFVVVANWTDYRDIFRPGPREKHRRAAPPGG